MLQDAGPVLAAATWLQLMCTLHPPSSLDLQQRRCSSSTCSEKQPKASFFPPSFNDINILLHFIGTNMQMNVCGKAVESPSVNKTCKQGLSPL